MFCSVSSAAIVGVEAVPIGVEADVSDGLPCFSMVGYVSSQVREAQDRVKTALGNLGIRTPPKRITINLAPGNIRKEGTRFDLPIAAAVLEALGYLDAEALQDTMLLGELHLDGSVERIPGVLPSVLTAKKCGCRVCIVPRGNLAEGRVVEGIRVIGIRNLEELCAYGGGTLPDEADPVPPPRRETSRVDFRDIRGQAAVKRAAVIAAAGFHNLLLSGPPGSGKSMTAERIPTIMPEISRAESLEITKIYSIAGLLPEGTALMNCRPFRAPHHTITPSALCGGGVNPKPGEVTLAHRGVLFLDELPEMNNGTIEMLRQPLEEHVITVSRCRGSVRFPASFLLVAAMNPCPCGYYPSQKCTCTVQEIRSYQGRVSQAILDRIDLNVQVPAASFADLTGGGAEELSSAAMREQVTVAVERQKERYKGTNILFNSELGAAGIGKYCAMTGEARRMLEQVFQTFGLSARGCHRVIKVARTIADLDGSDLISEAHISESICYRSESRR